MSQPFAIRLAENAVREFFSRWSAGLQPCLMLETQANGEILVSSRVSAPDYCHQTGQEDDQPPRQGHRHHRRRPPGPARLRRRERRANARAAAANAAKTVVETDAAALKAVATQDAAVQAVVIAPQYSDAAVQVECPLYQAVQDVHNTNTISPSLLLDIMLDKQPIGILLPSTTRMCRTFYVLTGTTTD